MTPDLVSAIYKGEYRIELTFGESRVLSDRPELRIAGGWDQEDKCKTPCPNNRSELQ